MSHWRSAGLGTATLFLSVLLIPIASAALIEVDDDNCPGPGSGTTLDPYCEIQVAIDAAIPSLDDVLVRCGTYVENIVLEDQVDVTGEGAQCTRIDGGANGSVVTIIGVTQAVFKGFTLLNGSATLGGGIYLEDSTLTIRNNRIVQNSAVGGTSGLGGGIHISEPLSRSLATAPVITNNIIRDNNAEGFGGGIEIYGGEATITNNLIEGNYAVESGGGIDIFFNANVSISNNTIVDNCLQSVGAVCLQGGGGIAIDGNSSVEIANNVVAWNEAETFFAGGIGIADSSPVNIVSNDVFENVPDNYAGIADPTGTDGNISADPLFVDQQLQFRGYLPRSDSPLVDGGAASPALPDDLRGVPRPLDGDGNGTGDQDIGARENEGVTRLLPSAPNTFSWDVSIDPAAQFNLYRGDLQTLIDTGVYVQDPLGGFGAAQWCDLVLPTQSDGQTPDPGQVYFYIAVVNNVVEGTLGFDSTPTERPYTDPNRCP